MPTKRDRTWERYRGSRQSRGYDRDWTRLRAQVLADEPLCRMCTVEGRITPATMVDHIQAIAVAPHLRLVRSNLQPLCKAHHDIDKQRIERGGRPRQMVGEDGWPT